MRMVYLKEIGFFFFLILELKIGMEMDSRKK